MAETTASTAAEYLAAVDHLLSGRPEEAVPRLESVVEADASPAAILALAKAYLQVRRGREAARLLDELRPRPESTGNPGVHAYLLLLSAAAAALDDRPEDACGLLADVGRIDPRMEHAAVDLRRRVEKGRPPVLRF